MDDFIKRLREWQGLEGFDKEGVEAKPFESGMPVTIPSDRSWGEKWQQEWANQLEFYIFRINYILDSFPAANKAYDSECQLVDDAGAYWKVDERLKFLYGEQLKCLDANIDSVPHHYKARGI